MELKPVTRAGNAEEPLLDVVFVHGLDGDVDDTWRNTETKNYWFNMLAEDIPQAQVWRLRYPASSVEEYGWMLKLAGKAIELPQAGKSYALPTLAGDALQTLWLDTVGTRPVVWVGHSLGGLLIKQILRQSSDGQGEDNKAIFNNTALALFLATPHTGSTLANLAKWFAGLAEFTQKAEELARGNAWVTDLADWYRKNTKKSELETPIDTKCFAETDAIQKGKFKAIVVDQASASAGWGATPLTGQDHVSIAKPRDRNQRQYKWLLQRLESDFLSSPKIEAATSGGDDHGGARHGAKVSADPITSNGDQLAEPSLSTADANLALQAEAVRGLSRLLSRDDLRLESRRELARLLEMDEISAEKLCDLEKVNGLFKALLEVRKKFDSPLSEWEALCEIAAWVLPLTLHPDMPARCCKMVGQHQVYVFPRHNLFGVEASFLKVRYGKGRAFFRLDGKLAVGAGQHVADDFLKQVPATGITPDAYVDAILPQLAVALEFWEGAPPEPNKNPLTNGTVDLSEAIAAIVERNSDPDVPSIYVVFRDWDDVAFAESVAEAFQRRLSSELPVVGLSKKMPIDKHYRIDEPAGVLEKIRLLLLRKPEK